MQRYRKNIYEPNKYIKIGLLKVWFIMFRDLKSAISLGWRLFLRDFRAKYEQQVFGVLWVLFIPLVAVLSFTLLANASIINIGEVEAPYTVYAFLGVTFWGLVQTLITQEAGILKIAGPFVKQINFPREALIISPLLISLLDFVIKLVLFVFICIFYQYFINISHILYIFTIIPAILFSLGIGLFLSIIGAILKDVTNIITYMFQFLLFITPVMYPKPQQDSILGKITEFNPLYYLIAVPRDLILFGKSDSLIPYMYCSAITLFIFLFAWKFYKVSIERIVEKI
ncbi:MAG: ABC transporter permease [Spirochaetes bacterium]|nr:ABC transporter permease [Spirochaetota bacterium]